MAKIQETVTVNIDDKSYEVSQFGDNIKQMIALMDEWRQKDADLTSELLMVRAAIRDIQNTILSNINAELNPPAEGGVAGANGGDTRAETPAA